MSSQNLRPSPLIITDHLPTKSLIHRDKDREPVLGTRGGEPLDGLEGVGAVEGGGVKGGGGGGEDGGEGGGRGEDLYGSQ